MRLPFGKPTPSSADAGLRLTPEDCASEEFVAARIGAQAARLVRHQNLYVFWLNRERTGLHLRAMRTVERDGESGSLQTEVRPDYSGLVADHHQTMVPLTLQPTETVRSVTRHWGTSAEKWLDLSIGESVIVRYLLADERGYPKIDDAALQRWSERAADAVTLAHSLVASQYERERLEHLLHTARSALDTAVRPRAAAELLLGLAAAVCSGTGAAVLLESETSNGQPIVFAERGGDSTHWSESLHGLRSPGDPRAFPTRLPIATVGGRRGWLVVAGIPEGLDSVRQTALKVFAERLGLLIDHQSQAQAAADSYFQTLRSLVEVMDTVTQHGSGHTERIVSYARAIAEELGLDPGEVEQLERAALLHDVGMISVPSELVLKPGRLDAAEYELLHAHTDLGAELAGGLPDGAHLGPVIGAHHERWDGLGYPRGLSGEEIPLGARILAVADTFEAKTTARSYRTALPVGRAIEDLRAAGSSQLDSAVVEALVRCIGRVDSTLHGEQQQAA